MAVGLCAMRPGKQSKQVQEELASINAAYKDVARIRDEIAKLQRTADELEKWIEKNTTRVLFSLNQKINMIHYLVIKDGSEKILYRRGFFKGGEFFTLALAGDLILEVRDGAGDLFRYRLSGADLKDLTEVVFNPDYQSIFLKFKDSQFKEIIVEQAEVRSKKESQAHLKQQAAIAAQADFVKIRENIAKKQAAAEGLEKWLDEKGPKVTFAFASEISALTALNIKDNSGKDVYKFTSFKGGSVRLLKADTIVEAIDRDGNSYRYKIPANYFEGGLKAITFTSMLRSIVLEYKNAPAREIRLDYTDFVRGGK
jgi:uncharacterized FlaG/YvyC family protein